MMAVSPPVAKRSLDGLLTVVVLVIIGASYLGWIVPYRQGFHCDDPDLEYRFTGDSISLGTLIALCLTVPILFILLTELGRHRPLSVQQTSPELRATGVRGKRLKTYWRCCFQVYGTYIQGLVCAIAVVEFLKMSVGGLRPHFIDSCKPDFSTINCSQGFVTNYTCTNKDNMSILRFMDIFKSFPSGHAALSVYMSVFLCFYINKQIVPWPTFLSTAMLQSMLLYWAGYCSVSRILDHRHHWWDVLVGLILGIICACYSAMWLWWNPQPFCTTGSDKGIFSTGYGREYASRSQRRLLLSSQASQTTDDASEPINYQSMQQESNHIQVQIC